MKNWIKKIKENVRIGVKLSITEKFKCDNCGTKFKSFSAESRCPKCNSMNLTWLNGYRWDK